jgi:predicted RND superfamily exporter protein
MSLRKALVGFLAASCLFLFVEVLYEHREIVSERPIAFAPLVVSALAVLVSLWAFAKWQPQAQKALQVVSVLLLLVGLAGIYFHNAERLKGEHHEEEHEAVEHGKGESHGEGEHTPPLAPLAFSGMGILGLIVTYPHWRQEESSH